MGAGVLACVPLVGASEGGKPADLLKGKVNSGKRRAEVSQPFDTFRVRWDPGLKQQIQPAGQENRIASYQVCDFNLPIAADALLSRGMMGDGVIDFATIGTWVRDASYTGDIEVEIFNQDIWDAEATRSWKP